MWVRDDSVSVSATCQLGMGRGGVQQGGVEGLILILDAFSDTLVLSLNYRDHKLHHNLTPDPVRASAGKRLWPKINTQSSHI